MASMPSCNGLLHFLPQISWTRDIARIPSNTEILSSLPILKVAAASRRHTRRRLSCEWVHRELFLKPFTPCDRNLQCSSALKLVSGSYYIPKQRQGYPLGDDAHFICARQHAVGIADGVGGYRSRHNIDAGNYARELISHVEKAVADGPIGAVDPMKVLTSAHVETKAKGGSTACILAIRGQCIHAVNIGDSGFMVVRGRHIVFHTPVQLHSFNFPFQLGCSRGSDSPSAAQTFEVAVEDGDVIVAGTDGLFDNLFDDEVAAAIIDFTRWSLDPQEMARLLAETACERSKDTESDTPFSVASYSNSLSPSSFTRPHRGGKKDDITVIVAKVINA